MKLVTAASLLTVSILFSTACADVEFLEPWPGSTVNAGDVLTAYWKESGEAPRLSELHDYDLWLCAGDSENEYIEELALLISGGLFDKGNSVSYRIQPDVGSDYLNAYFLKMVSRGSDNTTVVNYSGRFSVRGTTGKFSELVQYGLSNNTKKAIEHHQDLKVRKRQILAANVPVKDPYAVPYPQQSTGLTKYAPMGKRPATTITAKSGPPQFPASVFDMARTFLPIPTWQTTLTASRTWTTSGIENPATPAPHPNDDMQKYLKRWADEK